MGRSNIHLSLTAAVALAMCGLAHPALADEAVSPAPKVVHLKLRVDIAPDGATSVHADERIPASLRAPIEEEVGRWRFEPAMHDGHPASATTWVGAVACMVAEGDKVRLSVGYEGHGPGQQQSIQFSPTPPPNSLMRAGINTTLQLFYAVQPDGRGAFERVDFDPSVPEQFRPWFEKTMRQMVKVQRFEPERLDGQPVTTRMHTPVQMNLAPVDESRLAQLRRHDAERDAQLLHDQLSPACIEAAGNGSDQPVALDSPVRLSQTAPAAGGS